MAETGAGLGPTLKLIRRKRGFTAWEMSQRLGEDLDYMDGIEESEHLPSMEELEAIAKELGVPVKIIAFLASDKSELGGTDSKLANSITELAWLCISRGEAA